jgi:hypothetical protein
MRFETLKLVYKNMIWNRPKIGLWGLITVALLSTTNLYFNLLQFGHVTAAVVAIWALSLWFVGLPMILTLIDLKMSPKRMEKVWEQIAKK